MEEMKAREPHDPQVELNKAIANFEVLCKKTDCNTLKLRLKRILAKELRVLAEDFKV